MRSVLSQGVRSRGTRTFVGKTGIEHGAWLRGSVVLTSVSVV